MHNVETMYSRDTGNPSDIPWHFMIRGGTDASQTKITAAPKTVPDLLKVSGTGWKVDQYPIFTLTPDAMQRLNAGQLVDSIPMDDIRQFDGEEDRPEYWATVRETDGSLLGVSGSRFTPLQNEEAAEFLVAVLNTDEFTFETGGSLRGGQIVWYMASLNNPPKLPAGEELASYFSVGNWHNGKGSLRAMNHDVRIVCNNTFDWASDTAQSSWEIRHTESIHERVDEARKALRLVRDHAETLVKVANGLVTRPFKTQDMVDVLGVLYPIPPDSTPLTQKRVNDRVDEVMEVWKSSPNLENIRATAWGGFNAIVEFLDHSPSNYRGDAEEADEGKALKQAEQRMLSIMTPTGRTAQFKRRTLEVVANKAEVSLTKV